MILRNQNPPMISPPTIREQAVRKIIEHLIKKDLFKGAYVRRRLASYPRVFLDEKDKLVLEITEYYCKEYSSNELLSVLRDFDLVFGILDKKGHFIHQFEVYLLGLFLITLILPNDPDNLFLSKHDDIDQLFHSWLLTATAHDFGYPFQLAEDVTNKFAELYRKLGFEILSQKYSSILSGYRIDAERQLLSVKVLDAKRVIEETLDINGFIFEAIAMSITDGHLIAREIQDKLITGKSHGYVSAIIMCRNYFEHLSKSMLYGTDNGNKLVDILKMMAGAIALHSMTLHNYKKYIDKLNFKLNPLALLLFIIDNLQEWSRSMRPSLMWPSYSLSDLQINRSNIHLYFSMEHEKWDKTMKRRVRSSLKEKEDMLKLAVRNNSIFGIEITVTFFTNQSDAVFRQFSINI